MLAVVNSRAARLTVRYGVKPLLIALAAWWLLLHDASPAVQAVGFALVFMGVNVVVNSRSGRAVEQSTLHSLRVGWVRFTAEKIGTVVRGVMRFFERMLEAVDRTLYAVDEWLRFRGEGGRRGLVGKAVLGVVWFYIAYVFRFVVNLLVEPQVNPIKHFPVVTVSHKLLLPLAIPGGAQPSPLGSVLVYLFGMSKTSADATAATIVWGIPGIFGFLAWELKENWKLYRANLPATLKPVRFGSHGESVAQLLRPGFHSGTLPKAYAKLRRAHQSEKVHRSAEAGRRAGDGQEFPLAVHKHLESIEHVGESLRWFVERAFLALLNRHPAFAAAPVALRDTMLGATRVVLVFDCPGVSPAAMRVEFEQVGGWIVAEVPEPGWSAELPPAAAGPFAVALRGFFKMAAVDVVQAEVDACFAPRAVWWDLRPKVLLARPDDRPEVEATYALHERQMRPDFGGGPADPAVPVLHREKLLFRATEVTWREWVDAWRGADDGVPSASRTMPAEVVGAGTPGTAGIAGANGHVPVTVQVSPHAGG